LDANVYLWSLEAALTQWGGNQLVVRMRIVVASDFLTDIGSLMFPNTSDSSTALIIYSPFLTYAVPVHVSPSNDKIMLRCE
jgi:hypothetical protein